MESGETLPNIDVDDRRTEKRRDAHRMASSFIRRFVRRCPWKRHSYFEIESWLAKRFWFRDVGEAETLPREENPLQIVDFRFTFLVADTQLHKRLGSFAGPSTHWFIHPSVCLSVGRLHTTWKHEKLMMLVWMWGVGCPCPPIRSDIVTPRHSF